jgi:hypothetical protein
MFILFCILTYISIGIILAFTQESWWYYIVFQEHKKRNAEHSGSILCSIIFSGFLWPIYPVFRIAISLRDKTRTRFVTKFADEIEKAKSGRTY